MKNIINPNSIGQVQKVPLLVKLLTHCMSLSSFNTPWESKTFCNVFKNYRNTVVVWNTVAVWNTAVVWNTLVVWNRLRQPFKVNKRWHSRKHSHPKHFWFIPKEKVTSNYSFSSKLIYVSSLTNILRIFFMHHVTRDHVTRDCLCIFRKALFYSISSQRYVWNWLLNLNSNF